MTESVEKDQALRSQIETTTTQLYSTENIEERIAEALVTSGEFHEDITAAELEVILRNIVYVMFARQTLAGREVGILHNVPIMNIEICDGEAFVEFVVHIHKPIIVFIEFKYTLVNQNGEGENRLGLKDGSLLIKERTRRFDVKAKAALTAMNVPRIARQEMADLTEVIRITLPDQLVGKGVAGSLDYIALALNSNSLCVHLRGSFEPYSPAADQED